VAIKGQTVNEMIFWGATGQAKVLRDCMRASGVPLVALFDNNESLSSPFKGVPLYHGRKGFQEWLKQRESPEAIGFLVAIGGDKGRDRLEIHEYLKSFGLVPLRARHPTAFVADDVAIGAGSQILANASVCVESVIGQGCIVNTGAIVDHECRLGDGVHICPGAQLAGCVEVGCHATIGTGAVILPRISIGEGAFVGAGAVVIKDVVAHTVVAGNPAEIIRPIPKEKQ